MARHGLGLTRADLESEAGAELGFGTDPTAWGSSETDEITRVVDSALRRVYYTEAVPQLGIPAAYPWSFLKPVATVTVASGDRRVLLPDDFGGFVGRLRVSASGESNFMPLPLTSEPMLGEEYARYPDASGRPIFACEQAVMDTDPAKGQRRQLQIYPLPDQDYTLEFQYYFSPSGPTLSRPYPYGGAQHAETYKAAVMACCEFYLRRELGPQNDYFMARLVTSIEVDQRNQPATLGINRDTSDEMRSVRFRHGQSPVTFDGVEY